MLPAGITSSGFPSVRETCRRIGIEFDPWQQDLNKCLLAKDAYGLYAADTAVLSIPRQVGKTFDVGAVVFALCIAIPGLTVVWTAHRFKVSRESFNEMRSWAKSAALRPHVDYDEITTAAGNEVIPFRNGARIVFAARERGAIRGFTKVGVLVLDEGQILTESALSDLVPTTNQAPNPLIILMGTPPKPTDPGEAFIRLRAEALDGESSDVLYVEFSADEDCDPDDREQWKIANPSYPKRTPARAIKRLRKLLSPADFMREALGVWDRSSSPKRIHPDAWAALADEVKRRPKPAVFYLVVSPNSASAAIAVGCRRKRRAYVELADYRDGTGWFVKRCATLAKRYPDASFAGDLDGPLGAMGEALDESGVDVHPVTGKDHGRACAHLEQLVNNERLWHSGDEAFKDALDGAVSRDIGDKLWVWAPRKSTTDILPIVAATGAAWALQAVGDYDPLDHLH